jgi:hypothetical protein
MSGLYKGIKKIKQTQTKIIRKMQKKISKKCQKRGFIILDFSEFFCANLEKPTAQACSA